ncbi:MAG TPA: 6-phospho-beta-glucosidase [Anaerolineales bacterium]|nr:6-phospho-beta-glucosidase [Anaerolineales bacterium]
MKITVIGGGSTYTPELVNGFLDHVDCLPLRELWLMDIDRERLNIVGGFARRMVAARGAPFKVLLSTDQRESIAGASYVVTQLRVGMMPARRGDEYLGRRHALIGQETTGIGGMAKALRTIPVILKIARDIQETAPGALLANFTNPAGLVTEALARHAPQVAAVGVCNVGITTKMHLLAELEEATGSHLDPERAVLDTLGLNHLTWHRGFKVDGEELWPEILPAFIESLKHEAEPEWDVRTIESLGMIPNYYLQYFYYTDRKLKDQEAWPPSRAEEVMEIEKDLLRQYADPDLSEPPADLMKRGGAYYSTLATQLINSHHNDLGQIHVVNVRHNGAVRGWPADWVLELPARVDRSGVHPLPADPLPEACFGLVAQVKMYELLTVEAAVSGDRNAAYQALLAHPLGPKADQVQAVLEDMLETNKRWLPQFFR